MSLLKKTVNLRKCFKSELKSKEQAQKEENNEFKGIFFHQVERDKMILDTDSRSSIRLDDSLTEI